MNALLLSPRPHQLDNRELEMDVSKAAFTRAESFETELEDTAGDGAGMVTGIMGWLFVSVFNIMACVFSQQSIMEDSSICKYFDEETYLWWAPNQFSLIYKLFCRHLVWVQIFHAICVIQAATYLIIHRLLGANQPKEVALSVLLGMFYGLPGKSTVDSWGGNGKLWLFVWATFCLLLLVADVITLAVRSYKSYSRRTKIKQHYI